MKLNTSWVRPFMVTAGLVFGSLMAHAGGYALKTVEGKDHQALCMVEIAAPDCRGGIMQTGVSVPLVPGRSYLFWFNPEGKAAPGAGSPSLRAALCVRSESLDVDIPFDYVQRVDVPEALIENNLSPIPYAQWIAHLEENRIRIFFLTKAGFQRLPGGDDQNEIASPAAPAMEEAKAPAQAPQPQALPLAG